ncbi:hypothetical protein [Nocardia cerradoensis]|uniref:hypothetical protein n=1 Tax=Nocardia cerradoensis TaxID=85688 RepID=UPI00117D5D73|nr:hypothetical protein [Nocardia cerradoensis]
MLLLFMGIIVGGRLIPRSWVKSLLAEKDARIEYQETAMAEQRATIASLVQQNAELTVSGRLSVALLQSIQTTATSNHTSTTDPGSGHVAPSVQT